MVNRELCGFTLDADKNADCSKDEYFRLDFILALTDLHFNCSLTALNLRLRFGVEDVYAKFNKQVCGEMVNRELCGFTLDADKNADCSKDEYFRLDFILALTDLHFNSSSNPVKAGGRGGQLFLLAHCSQPSFKVRG